MPEFRGILLACEGSTLYDPGYVPFGSRNPSPHTSHTPPQRRGGASPSHLYTSMST